MNSEAIERFARAVAKQAVEEGYVFPHREVDVTELVVDVFREQSASAEGRAALIDALGGEQVGSVVNGKLNMRTGERSGESRPVFAFPSEGTAAEVETP